MFLKNKLIEYCNKPSLIFLSGDLGVGKTTLVRDLLRKLGYAGRVKSPTYGLVEIYDNLSCNFPIYHFDLYRLINPVELETLGFRDYLGTGVIIIEWPEKALELLPPPDLWLTLEIGNDGTRKITEK